MEKQNSIRESQMESLKMTTSMKYLRCLCVKYYFIMIGILKYCVSTIPSLLSVLLFVSVYERETEKSNGKRTVTIDRDNNQAEKVAEKIDSMA